MDDCVSAAKIDAVHSVKCDGVARRAVPYHPSLQQLLVTYDNWDAVATPTLSIIDLLAGTQIAPRTGEAHAVETDIRSADIALIEAEVEFRLEARLEQAQAEAEEQRVRDLARIEREAATRLEPAVAKARVAGEAAALQGMAAEVERVRREADEQRAAEVARQREQLEHLRSKADASRDAADVATVRARYLEAELAQIKDDADVVRDAAIEEALKAAGVAAARARDLEAELARVTTDAAVVRDAAIEEARLAAEAEVARVEIEARLAAETYRSLGYSADFFEDYENGVWLTIRRGGDAVGEVAVALLPEGPDAQVSIAIKRFRPNELLKVTTTDDFEPQDADREQSNRDTCVERLQRGGSEGFSSIHPEGSPGPVERFRPRRKPKLLRWLLAS